MMMEDPKNLEEALNVRGGGYGLCISMKVKKGLGGNLSADMNQAPRPKEGVYTSIFSITFEAHTCRTFVDLGAVSSIT